VASGISIDMRRIYCMLSCAAFNLMSAVDSADDLGNL
jgi:hypothetical protein